MTMTRFEKMGGTYLSDEELAEQADWGSIPTIGWSSGVQSSDSEDTGSMEEMQALFEELMGGSIEDVEGYEDFDWEALWNSLMGISEEEEEVSDETSEASSTSVSFN